MSDLRIARRTVADALSGLLGAVIATFFVAFVLYLTFNAFATDALPQMDYWHAFGFVWLFNYAVNRLRDAS